MNQCKRGPNVRVIWGDNIVVSGLEGMTEAEKGNKAFNGVVNEGAVARVLAAVTEKGNNDDCRFYEMAEDGTVAIQPIVISGGGPDL